VTDMNAVIAPKSDQLNADTLLGGPRVIQIEEVLINPGTEQPVTIHFAGDEGKPWKPCKSMSRVLVHAWGPDAKLYAGRYAELYLDPTVKWGGMAVGGVRISRLSHIERDLVMALTATKGKKSMYTVKPLQVEQAAVGLTYEEARDLIDQAADLHQLRAVWSRKSMAPFRGDLQEHLDARKAELMPVEEDDLQDVAE